MKTSMKFTIPIITSLLFIFCSNVDTKKSATETKAKIKSIKKHPKFNDYWYEGKAEITSYKLTQNRYGEHHEGTAVNIFVTEDFLPEKQVKADYQNEKNVPVLKLNSTKKFTTGIYPYSIMTSTFSPININKKTIKISFSSQEWCGNTFVQLNNREKFEIDFYSYFENNADRELVLEKNVLENELWNQLRINPKSIKKGRYKVIPSFEYLALNHQKIKAFDAEVNLIENGNFMNFSVYYPTLKRKLTVKLTKEFPYLIEGWEETSTKRGKTLTTKAAKINTIKSAYWTKNGATDTKERKELGL
ncbi:septum formation inhibitor Maf [Polaribacter sp.]|uniref:septum formation inhibitor Maf n=1 Tax=Polaribacter sp. TaxID=1920175 RepID=UPI003F6BFB3C